METPLMTIFAHHRWANLELVDACDAVPESVLEAVVPGTYGTIRETLHHLVELEERYLSALQPGFEQHPAGELAALSALRQRAVRSGQALIEVAAGVRDDQRVQTEWAGRSFNLPIGIFLSQAITHAAEHRNQIATILTQQGVTPPILDAWTFARESGES